MTPTSAAGSIAGARYVVLSGGYGGARFLQGLLRYLERDTDHAESTAESVCVVANTADDLWVHGLKVCPDLDTVMYTLGGGIDPERGWGRTEESWRANEELAAYGVEGTWFGLGDRDLATHLVRTQMLGAGYSLSQVTAALCARWKPGVRLLPMSDDRVETHIAVADEASPSGTRVMHFQEYWVRHRAQPVVEGVLAVGMDKAAPAPGVLEGIRNAEVILVPPSNPIVSVGTVLAVPGIREAVATSNARVVGLSPIVGGDHVRGMAAQLLSAGGHEVTALGVARLYGARSAGGVLDAWLVDERDQHLVSDVEGLGMRCAAIPLMMTDPEATAVMAAAALQLAAAGPAS